jgi:hypothetical protein
MSQSKFEKLQNLIKEIASSCVQLEEKKRGRCWKGYEPVPGKKPYSKGSCQKASESEGERLEEAGSARSISRAIQHFQNRNVGMISPNRQDRTRDENKRAHEGLKKDIKSAGFGYVKAKGTYPEKQEDGTIAQAEEPTFLITAPPEKKKQLHSFLMKHGAKYNQDTIFFKGHDEDEASLHTTVQRTPNDSPVGSSFSVGKFHPNKLSDYMTKLKGDRKFTFESFIIEWHSGWLGEWQKSIKESKKSS